jgi:hypothetical protein
MEGTLDGVTWFTFIDAAGPILSITGTAGRITVTAGANPVIDIDPTYIGQNTITTLGTITTGVWAGTAITEIHGGTNQTTYALGDSLYASAANTLAKLAGNITAVKQYLSQTGTGAVSAAPAWATIAGGDITGAALSKTDDTNVTMTLGGTPLTALLRATSLTLGWAGFLSLARGGTNADTSAQVSNGGIVWSNATQMQILAGTATARQMLQSGATATPAWSTTTWPATSTINRLLYSSAANVISDLATANNGMLVTSSAGVPSILAGPGTTGNMLQSNAATAPSFSTATWPSTTTINQILYSSAANTVAGLATANGATLITSSAGVPSLLALTSFQSIDGVTSGTPTIVTKVGRNRVVNGDMQVWQRGAGGSAIIAQAASVSAYTTDRWQFLTGANQASTITQAAGATSGSFIAQVQRNNAQTGTGVMRFCTSLTRDMCIGAAGNIITLSFKAKSGANFSPTSSNITVTVYSGTGTTDISGINGAFTGNATPISQTQALTTTLTNYTFSSSALGATITQLAVEFSWTPTGTAGADDSAFFTDVQLEISNNQTAFDRRGFDEQLARCQKFYWKSFNYATAPAQNAGTNTGEILFMITRIAALAMTFGPYSLPTQMFAAPSFTTFNPSVANAQVRDATAAADMSATVIGSQTSRKYFYIQATGNAGGTINGSALVHVTAESELT